MRKDYVPWWQPWTHVGWWHPCKSQPAFSIYQQANTKVSRRSSAKPDGPMCMCEWGVSFSPPLSAPLVIVNVKLKKRVLAHTGRQEGLGGARRNSVTISESNFSVLASWREEELCFSIICYQTFLGASLFFGRFALPLSNDFCLHLPLDYNCNWICVFRILFNQDYELMIMSWSYLSNLQQFWAVLDAFQDRF